MGNDSRNKAVEELGVFFEQHLGLLYSFAADYLNQIEDREDCIQNVLVKILNRLDLFLSFSEPRRIAYCKKAIYNEAVDIAKKKSRYSATELIENIPSDFDLVNDFILKEQNEILQQGLKSLRPEYRQVIEQYYFSGLSADEIALQMGLSLSTVWTYLSKARAEIKRFLEDNGYSRKNDTT